MSFRSLALPISFSNRNKMRTMRGLESKTDAIERTIATNNKISQVRE